MTIRVRFLLFIGTTLLALWISFLAVSGDTVRLSVIYLGYPFISLLFVGFVASFHPWNKQFQIPSKEACLKNLDLLLVPLFFALALNCLESTGFKIIFDELLLSSTAEMMHFDRLAATPQSAQSFQNHYLLTDAFLDKRPLFYPFLLSLTHDLLGFDYRNAFLLNGLLSFVFLSFIYAIGRYFSGRIVAIGLVVLTFGLPLFVSSARSGHFEILNLVFLVTVTFLSFRYIQRPSEKTLVSLLLAMILLAQTRYENVIFLIPFSLIILIGWQISHRFIFPKTLIFSPLFFILYVFQFRVTIDNFSKFWQEGPHNRIARFSKNYIFENGGHTADFLFAITQMSMNSFILSVFGISALIVMMGLLISKRSLFKPENPEMIAWLAIALGVILHLMMLFTFYWGIMTMYVTSRLSFPLHLLFLLSIPIALKYSPKNFLLLSTVVAILTSGLKVIAMEPGGIIETGIHVGIILVLLSSIILLGLFRWKTRPDQLFLITSILFLLAVNLPTIHNHRYIQSYLPSKRISDAMKFIEDRKDQSMLWIGADTYVALLLRKDSRTSTWAAKKPEEVKRIIDDRIYSHIYVIQEFLRNTSTGEMETRMGPKLDPNIFQMKLIEEFPLGFQRRIQISELINVYPAEKVPSPEE